MFKARRYLRPQVEKAVNELNHILDEATLLVSALILQQSGTNPERFKTFDIKKASIDSLNGILQTLKVFVKDRLHFIDETIDEIREDCLLRIKNNNDFARIIIHTMNLNLISDNNDIALYLAPYINYWDTMTSGIQALILNHTIKSINTEIQRAQIAERISKNF